MQINEQHKELRRIPFMKDGRGHSYSLVILEDRAVILDDAVQTWQNGTKSRDGEMYFPNQNFVMGNYFNHPIKLDDYLIYPIYAGATAYIEGGVRVYPLVVPKHANPTSTPLRT